MKNPKSEIRNPKQIRMTKIQDSKREGSFGHLNFDIVSDFDIRASDFPAGVNTAQLGLWVFLATVTMLFAGFTSAYLVRQAGSDWQPIPLPPILWFNTAALLLSSLTLEVGRAWRQTKNPKSQIRNPKQIQNLNVPTVSDFDIRISNFPEGVKGWLLATTLLGVAFLVGQLFAWRQLAAHGVYLPSHPHSSFFYILTGVHGLHLLGGVGALVYVLMQARRAGSTPALYHRLKLCATYWHFVGGLWLYLFLVLFVF